MFDFSEEDAEHYDMLEGEHTGTKAGTTRGFTLQTLGLPALTNATGDKSPSCRDTASDTLSSGYNSDAGCMSPPVESPHMTPYQQNGDTPMPQAPINGHILPNIPTPTVTQISDQINVMTQNCVQQNLGIPSPVQNVLPSVSPVMSQGAVMSPQPNVMSPQTNVMSPQINVMSPHINVMTPQQMSPQSNVMTPQQMSPQQNVMSPQQMSPQQSVMSPQLNMLSPQQGGTNVMSPQVPGNVLPQTTVQTASCNTLNVGSPVTNVMSPIGTGVMSAATMSSVTNVPVTSGMSHVSTFLASQDTYMLSLDQQMDGMSKGNGDQQNMSPPRTSTSLSDHTYGMAIKGSPPVRTSAGNSPVTSTHHGSPLPQFDMGFTVTEMDLENLLNGDMGTAPVSDHDYSKPGNKTQSNSHETMVSGFSDFSDNFWDTDVIDPNLNAVVMQGNNHLFGGATAKVNVPATTAQSSSSQHDSILVHLLGEQKANAGLKSIRSNSVLPVSSPSQQLANKGHSLGSSSISIGAFPSGMLGAVSAESRDDFAMKFAENMAEQQLRQQLLSQLAGETDLSQVSAKSIQGGVRGLQGGVMAASTSYSSSSQRGRTSSRSSSATVSSPTKSTPTTNQQRERGSSTSSKNKPDSQQRQSTSILEKFLTSDKPLKPNRGSDDVFPEIETQISQMHIAGQNQQDEGLLQQLLTGKIDGKRVQQYEQNVIETRKRDDCDSGNHSESELAMDLDDDQPVFSSLFDPSTAGDMNNLLDTMTPDIQVGASIQN